MPLCPQALIDARTTAARLILLLPSQVQSLSERIALPIGQPAVPWWVPVALLFAALALGILCEMLPPATPTGAVASVGQPIAQPQATTN
jgi:hypothetical protein